MGLRCRIGWHPFKPAKVFHTMLVDEIGGKPLGHRSHYTGHVCAKCGARKLKRMERRSSPSVGERQQAYDWLNEVRQGGAQVLRLVKK